MGEDFPLDPNHVIPPQEGVVTPIEVTSHDAEQSPAAPDDVEQVPSSYVHNKDKAEVMAHAQNDATDAGEQFPQNASLRAGIEHDMAVAKEKVKGYEPSRADKERADNDRLRYNINKRNQVLGYSNAIVEYSREHGDKPSTALQALAAVHKLVQNTGHESFETEEDADPYAMDTVRVSFDKSENVIVETGDDQQGKAEKWTLSMFHGATYEVTESHPDTDGDFDEAFTTKRRYLQPQDVARLEEVLAPAITYKAEERKRIAEEHERYYGDGQDEHEVVSPSDSFGHQAGWSS